MPLSEEELQRLAELEASLVAEDPQLAENMQPARHVEVHRRSAALAGLGFLVGVIMLIAGMHYFWLISVIGFVAMFTSTVVAINSWKFVTDVEDKKQPRSRSASQASFMNRMEDRWRRRQSGGIF